MLKTIAAVSILTLKVNITRTPPMRAFHQGLVFSNLDQLIPDESFFLIGPIVVLNRLEKVIGYSF